VHQADAAQLPMPGKAAAAQPRLRLDPALAERPVLYALSTRRPLPSSSSHCRRPTLQPVRQPESGGQLDNPR
jgi:hypothetical protein